MFPRATGGDDADGEYDDYDPEGVLAAACLQVPLEHDSWITRVGRRRETSSMVPVGEHG